MEQFASIFKQNNISVDTFVRLVNKDTSDEEKSLIRRVISEKCGLSSGQIVKLCSYVLEMQQNTSP